MLFVVLFFPDTSDFHPLSFEIDCGEVESHYCFNIKIEDDSYPEDDEIFVVYLTGLSSCVVSASALAEVKIIDNDEPEEEDTVQLENSVEFKFMSRQYTCEERSDEWSPCQVCIGAFGVLYYSESVNLSTIEGSANSEFQLHSYDIQKPLLYICVIYLHLLIKFHVMVRDLMYGILSF